MFFSKAHKVHSDAREYLFKIYYIQKSIAIFMLVNLLVF